MPATLKKNDLKKLRGMRDMDISWILRILWDEKETNEELMGRISIDKLVAVKKIFANYENNSGEPYSALKESTYERGRNINT